MECTLNDLADAHQANLSAAEAAHGLQVLGGHLAGAHPLVLAAQVGGLLDGAAAGIDALLEATQQGIACVAGHLNTGRVASGCGRFGFDRNASSTHDLNHHAGEILPSGRADQILHGGLGEVGGASGAADVKLTGHVIRARLGSLSNDGRRGWFNHGSSLGGRGSSRVAPGQFSCSGHRGFRRERVCCIHRAHHARWILASDDQRNRNRLPIGGPIERLRFAGPLPAVDPRVNRKPRGSVPKAWNGNSHRILGTVNLNRANQGVGAIVGAAQVHRCNCSPARC